MNASPSAQYEGFSHIPVMLPEVLEYLQPKDGGVYVDGTFGAGGYSAALLSTTHCTVLALDRDPGVEIFAAPLREKHGTGFKLLKGNFADMELLLAAEGITQVDGIMLDIGVSSMQLDNPERGFSFQKDGPLDMRMEAHGTSAEDVVNGFGEGELADIIYSLGGERHSRRIARAIVTARAEKKITRTGELKDIIHTVLHKRGKDAIDPATRTFQAIRIYVNHELDSLQTALSAAERLLRPGGRLVIVSFHELEDSIVKAFFAERSGKKQGTSRYLPEVKDDRPAATFTPITRKAVLPAEHEIRANIRARSARLRAATRTEAPAWQEAA